MMEDICIELSNGYKFRLTSELVRDLKNLHGVDVQKEVVLSLNLQDDDLIEEASQKIGEKIAGR